MKIPREDFEKYGYPNKFPDFNRLMAYCDSNKLRMSFYDEPGFLAIRVYGQDNEPITTFNNYTMYYDTTEKKMYFLDMSTWDEGFDLLIKSIESINVEEDESIISSLGLGVG